MKVSGKSLLVSAVVAIAVVAASQAMIPSLYYGLHSRQDTVIGGVGFIAFVGCFALALAAYDKFRNGLLKLFLCAFLFYNIYFLVKGHIVTGPLPVWAKAAAVAVFVALFLLLLCRIGVDGWRNVSKAIIVACSIFVLSPVLISWGTRASTTQGAAFEFARAGNINNYLILVLDETSPEYVTGFVQELTRARLHVASAEVAAAGQSTINAIPSMLSRSRHDDVAPCTPTSLCGAQSFDFSVLTASSPKTDIVGFWHPYCAIKGLRSCFREESVFEDSSSVDFGFYTLWCGQFNRGGILPFCEKVFPRAAAVARTKRSMAARIDQAPFWREGGLLYVHVPLPHPSMGGDFPSLRSEYESNVAEAGRLVSKLAQRLSATFGDDFTLVITSDHALRIALWCAAPEYARTGCAKGLPADRGRVPFIIASPKPVMVSIPGSNLGLLAAASRR